MNLKTCLILEFERIKALVSSYTLAEESAALLLGQEPLVDAAALDGLRNEVLHIMKRLDSGDCEPRRRLPEIGAFLPKLALDRAALTLDEVFALGCFLEEGARVLRWIFPEAPPSNLDCSAWIKEIFAVINHDGQMRDLPELRRIRDRIAVIQRELKAITASFVRNEATRSMLQSDLPSTRDGRTVIALKANFRGRVRGIVHEVSASGHTLFIEPEALIEKNNDLRIAERELDAEIRRILRELTARLSPYTDAIAAFHAELLRLDTIRARAHYAAASKGVFPENDAGEASMSIKLLRARHPLLGASVVPIDLVLRDGVRALIITGPNAGGKTAAIKTVGLFVLMNQSGFALPAARAELPVFDDVFADIGDEQSLSGALSTFSAHAHNLAAICQGVTARSLVLLDELGAGTGVEEGGALAMALLDYFIGRGASLLVTTHSSALKNYGWTHPAVENASMEFDTATHQPTYRVLMGVPGESRAIAIAKRSGIPLGVINGARVYLENGDSDTARVIAGLQSKIVHLEHDRRELEEARRGFEKESAKLDERSRRVREKEAALKAGELGKLRALLNESRKKLENLVRTLQENASAVSRDKTLAVKAFLNELEAAVQQEEAVFEHELEGEAENMTVQAAGMRSLPPYAIAPGLHVLAGAHKRPGVVKRQGKRGAWLVEVGSLSLSFKADELFPAPKTVLMPSVAAPDLVPALPLRAELDVRGFRLAEALEVLQHQLDAAITANLTEFAVIHGTGDGILQHGVHEYLKTQAVVAEYYFSRPELGGTGRTEIRLK